MGGSNFVEWMPDYWYEGEDTTVLSSFESTNTHDICWEEKNKALYSLLPPWLKRLTVKRSFGSCACNMEM